MSGDGAGCGGLVVLTKTAQSLRSEIPNATRSVAIVSLRCFCESGSGEDAGGIESGHGRRGVAR